MVEGCRSLPLRMLVNNVGISKGGPAPVTDFKVEVLEELINVNCRFATLLTHGLLPQLIRNASSERKCCIIDVASQTGILHVPWCVGYSATKAYNLAWSHSLREEVRGDNIEVFALTPGLTESAMVKVDRPSPLVSTALTCASSGLNAIGSGYSHCGYWVHHLLLYFMSSVPDFILKPGLLKSMKDMRKLQDERDRREGNFNKSD